MTRLAIRTMNKKKLAAVLLCTAVCAGMAGTTLQSRDTLAENRRITIAIDAGMKNRGLSGRDDLTGTNWSKVPVTLIEMGFMTNKKEDKKMQKYSFQKKMAKGIADGVDSYFGR